VERFLATLADTLHFAVRHEHRDTSTTLDLKSLQQQSRVGIAWFSDTVLIYGVDSEEDSSRRVLETAGWLLFTAVVARGPQFRVGVDYGELYADSDNSLFVGRALVKAHKLEQAQDWMGGALTPDAATQVNPTYGQASWVCPYDIPMKRDAETSHGGLAINWPMGGHSAGLPWWSSPFRPPTDCAHDEDAVRKWRNAHAFHRSVCQFCHVEAQP
jgi:hypothetical protein